MVTSMKSQLKTYLCLAVAGNRPARWITARNEHAARRKLPYRGEAYVLQEVDDQGQPVVQTENK